MKILVTGGHVTPAIAVIDKLKDQKIVFVGRKYPIPGEKIISLEYKEISKRGIKFINLETGRLTRLISLRSIINLLLIPYGFFQAAKILFREKPDKIVSFGGYIAFPICIIGALFRIPIYTHEQTISLGLANRIIANLSRKVFVSFEESKKELGNSKKIIVTGNPIRPEVFQIIKKPFELPASRKVIYITGGSLGAHSVNVHIKAILPKLLSRFTVIHQVGDTQEFNDYKNLMDLKESLPQKQRVNYFPQIHFSGDEIGFIYSVTDLVIARAGANTFFELGALQKPAIFIPLPWSARGEQQKHAELFKQAGCGEIFDQSHTSEELFTLIETVMKNIDSYKKKFGELHIQNSTHAQDAIVREILT